MPSRALPVLVFDLAEVRCALPAAAVDEVLPVPRLDQPPGCPPAVAGVLTLSGRSVPVLALARLLGLAPTPPDALYGHVVMLAGAAPTGLLVDRAVDLVSVWQAAIEPVADADHLAGCVTGRFASVGRTVHLLDADRLLDRRERAIVADVAARQAERAAAFAASGR